MSNEREFTYLAKNKKYRVRVWSDIEARGGERGKGTSTSMWECDANGNCLYGIRGEQGPFSEAVIKRLIKAFKNYPQTEGR
jgi:hypothetical protein